MALIIEDKKKIYEKPESGSFVGVIADVVDLGPKSTPWGVKNKVRIVWLLGKLAAAGGGYANDSEGNPYRVMMTFNATMNEGGDLFKNVRSILSAAPPVPYDLEQLIGKPNLLFIVKEEDTKKKGNFYANVKGILPLGTETALAIPTTFTRNKDKKDNRTPAAQATQQASAPVTATATATAQISANLTGVGAVAPPTAPKADVVLDEKF